ncbi:MAG: hypothetical protein M1825_005452 [Sarcosagium campestre]|nr:MAG: hypothetical protein M1825_005452 [Sarcosagium campestre]
MSSSGPGHLSSKSVNVAQAQTISPPQVQAPPAADSTGQRRSGGLGSFGAGSPARSILPSARNNQSSRRQHRGQKKPRFANEDALAESAAMKSTSSRKGQTSITHLMNFSLPPRPQYNQRTGHQYARRNPTWGLGSGYHAVDKAKYVHANYRFVVDPRSDYSAQAVDADIHLEWSSVLQILASAQTQCSACPICLSTPVAPRMAKCGHIFCLPCLIRYMHASDDVRLVPEKKARWKKCPICWDSIYLTETRPVRWYTGQEGPSPREGEDVILRLVMRQPGTTLALPRDGADVPSNLEEAPWHFAAEVMDYARVMRGSEGYMTEQFDQEIDRLQQLEREDELMYGDEPEWTKRAVGAIHDAKDRIKGIGDPPSLPSEPAKRKEKRPPIKFNDTDEGVPDMYLVQQASKLGQSASGRSSTSQDVVRTGSTQDLAGDSTSSLSRQPPPQEMTVARETPLASHNDVVLPRRTGPQPNISGAHPHDSPYYFYQALLHYYLSPLDIRILKSAFGSFSSFPATILPRVERVSTGHIVDDELRKRAKYLAHLPYGCEVGFLECDWTDVVAPEILAQFKPETDRRRKKNKDKEAREEKERVRAEKEEEDKRYAAARRKRPSISKESVSEDELRSVLPTPAVNISSSLDVSSNSASPPWPQSGLRHKTGSGFATLASPSTSPDAPRTVWGTTALVPPSSPQLHTEPDSSENDGWLQDWEKDLLHEDSDLVAQVQAASIADANVKALPNGMGSGAKKKKGKKITLMSTNARRGA